MDRVLILGDAIKYMKDLNHKIDDIHNELKSTPPSLMQTRNLQSLTPTLPFLPSQNMDEICHSSLPSPYNGQPVRVSLWPVLLKFFSYSSSLLHVEILNYCL